MKFFLGALIWLIAIFIFTIPLAILALVKLIVIAIYCRFSCNQDELEIKPLASGDCIVATDTTWKRPIVNVGFVLEVDGEIGIDRFREHFANCFNLHENDEDPYSKFFSFLVVRGGYVFRASSRKNFNLSQQIVERKLGYTEIECLEDFLSKWILNGYQENQPCWEMAVIHIPPTTPDSSIVTAFAFKGHHGFFDGYSLLHIIDKITGNTSPYLVKEFEDGLLLKVKNTLEAPLNLGRLSGVPPEKNPFRVHLDPPPNRKYEWMFSFTSFPLEDWKLLRRKNGGVHMTSVIWTVITGAMRRFLEEEKMEEIPEFIKIGNTLAWPRHPTKDPNARNEDKICNHWVAGIFQFPLREPNPIIRLELIEKEYISYLSQGMDKFCKRVLYPVIWAIPGPLLVSAFASKDLGISGGLTTLIGGDSYKVLGHSVKSIHPILAIHDNAPYQPLSCYTFSHSGKMELTMMANPQSIIKDKMKLDRICKILVHDEIQEFLRITNNQSQK